MNHFKIVVFFSVLIFTACNPCRSGCDNGICQEGICECNVWWEGDACEKSVLLPFEGNYAGSINCEGQTQAASFTLTVNSGDASKMKLSNGYELQFVTKTRFDVLVSENETESKIGSGEILVNSLSFNSEVSDSLGSYTCLTTATLQD
mgnify:CR=1 FL=1